MIVDSSALVAIVFREPGHEELLEKIATAGACAIAAPSLVESAIVVSARLGRDARPLVSRMAAEAGIEIVPFTEVHFGTAVDAWLRFGKGHHSAALNFGDCIAYAVAAVSRRPLLCVGDDFRRTGLPLA